MRGEREKERGEDLVVHPGTEGGVGPEVGGTVYPIRERNLGKVVGFGRAFRRARGS